MSKTEWLATLQPGDRVFVGSRYSKEVKTVQRLTSTQILVPWGNSIVRFRKKDGWEVGADAYHALMMSPYTEEEAEALALQEQQTHLCNAMHNVRRAAVEQLNKAECERLLQILQDYGLRN